MNDYMAVILGIICAGIGGDLLVRGAVGLAFWARVSPGIIGVTVVAFATSSPELSVAVNAGLAGQPQIALGDSLGSNVVNVALILAIALVISGIQCPRDNVKRDFPVAMSVPVIIGVLMLDGMLSRLDGFLMLSMFLAWLAAAVIEARKQRGSASGEISGKHRGWLAVLFCIVGLGFLIAAGNLFVSGAQGIAIALGINVFVIGATIVALGTSTPELATTVIAKLRRHDDISLGNVLGSNIFNGLFIVAVAAILSPITISWREVTVALGFGILVLVCTYPTRGGFIGRWRGFLLLGLYAVYLATILQFHAA
ncbi:MAG TPA: calcium/sodium antiporter [Acidobacteriota bacterium]|nr:calcium/sodium antiporter [Acidobacteriota bacterium]